MAKVMKAYFKQKDREKLRRKRERAFWTATYQERGGR